MYAFCAIRQDAPDLLAWFATGNVLKVKALAALSRFDEPTVAIVARRIVADDMSVLESVVFCDRVAAAFRDALDAA